MTNMTYIKTAELIPFKQFFDAYMRIHPRASNDMIIYQINKCSLTVGDFKAMFKGEYHNERCVFRNIPGEK